MLEEHYRMVKELFFAAVELESEEQERFLIESCQGDETLLIEVRSLIGSWREEPDFLDRAPLFFPLSDGAEAEAHEEERPATSPLDLRHLLEGWQRYSLESCLGTGGTSVVYRATDRRSQRPVAIKFLVHLGEDRLARFQREAEALARIAHPNVLELYETGSVEGIPYLAMKLVAGPDLMGIRRETTLAQQVELMRKVALGLRAAHELGVVHRDVKPSNILVERGEDDELVPYLADFGIARDDDGGTDVTRTGMLVGTPSYLAPERLRGKPGSLDQRSDVYALGVTLYELLTGRRPYSSSSTLEMLFKIRDGEITLPRDAKPDLPAGLEAILLKSMALEPEQRYPSAGDLADDLGRFLAGGRIAAQPLGRISRALRRTGARRAAVIVAGAAAALLAIAFAVRWGLSAPSSENRGLRGSSTPLAGNGVVTAPGEGAAPRDPEAARLYAQGLANLRRLDALKARVFLETAIAAEPEHPLLHAALSAALRQLGHDQAAQRSAVIAFESPGDLPATQRLEVEAQYRVTRAEWQDAAAIYRQLQGSFPDRLDYGLRLADVQIEAGLGTEALVTLAELGQWATAAGADPRIDLTEARAAEATSDYPRARAAAERAIHRGKQLGASMLVARGLLKKAEILLRVDDMETALTTAEEAKQAFAGAGDPSGMADALMVSATALNSLGRLPEVLERSREAAGIYREIGRRRGAAKAVNQIAIAGYRLDGNSDTARERFLEALAIYREIGDRRGVATSHNNIALVLSGAGDSQAAAERYRHALVIQREIGDREGMARSLGNLALALQQQNDLDGAVEKQRQSLAIKREIGDRSGVVLSLLNLGHYRRLQGETETAAGHYQQALEHSEALGWAPGKVRALDGLGRIHYLHGELAEARRDLQQALSLHRPTGSTFSSGQLMLARVLLAEGRWAEAEAAARPAATTSRFEAEARVLLGLALLRQGQTAAAHAEMERAQSRAPTGTSASKLGLRLDLARLLAALAGPAEAREARAQIDAAHAAATAAGLRLVAFEAELARAEIDLASQPGHPETRQRLEALITLTRDRGLALYTERARALLRGAPLEIEAR